MNVNFEYLKNMVDKEKEKNKNPLKVLYSYVYKISENDIKKNDYSAVSNTVDYIIKNEIPPKYTYISSVIKHIIKIVRLDFDDFSLGTNYIDDYLNIQINMIISNKDDLFKEYDLFTLDDIVSLININDYDMFVKTIQVLVSTKYDFIDLLNEFLILKKGNEFEVDKIVKRIDITLLIDKYKNKKNKIAFRKCFEYIVKTKENVSLDVISNILLLKDKYSWILSSFTCVCSKDDGLALLYGLLKDTEDFLCIYNIEDKLDVYFDSLFRLNKNINKSDVLNYEVTHLFLKCLKHENKLYN